VERDTGYDFLNRIPVAMQATIEAGATVQVRASQSPTPAELR
jgi:hypothetical protein